MDIVQFADAVSASKPAPPIDRWTERLYDVLASHVIQLARYVDDLPPDLRERYVDVVRSTLDRLPPDMTLTVAPTVLENLRRVWPDGAEAALGQRLAVP